MSANKSFSSETSERYARALFELSKESNELEKTEKNISDFKLLYYGSDEIKNFVKDNCSKNKISNKQIHFIMKKYQMKLLNNYKFTSLKRFNLEIKSYISFINEK